MLDTMGSGESNAHFDLALRGFPVVYRRGEVNHCPSCGRTHWLIGRLSAECGFCGAVLALDGTGMTGTGLTRRNLPRAA